MGLLGQILYTDCLAALGIGILGLATMGTRFAYVPKYLMGVCILVMFGLGFYGIWSI